MVPQQHGHTMREQDITYDRNSADLPSMSETLDNLLQSVSLP